MTSAFGRGRAALSRLVPYAKARGVTLRAILGYAGIWAMIVLASRFSVSALGLQFAPPGSHILDTVAVLLLALPCVVVTRCLVSRLPEYERTRSRAGRPYRLGWSVCVTLAALGAPVAAVPFLHRAVNSAGFLAAVFTVYGVGLALTALTSTVAAGAGVFAFLAVFSTPRLVPWHANVLYNAELVEIAVPLGLAVLAVGVVLAGLLTGDARR